MGALTTRRTVALLTSAALLAALTSITLAAPVSAATPTCNGRPATITDNDGNDADPTVGIIVGTNGNDVIVGTNAQDTIKAGGGRDLICGRDGADFLYGGGARDRIFGGSGDDSIYGGRGNDDLIGFRGADRLFGGPNNDYLNGGPQTDLCLQGSGRGPIRYCEKADLRINVISPASGGAGVTTFTVKVTNRGPNAASYSYWLDEDNNEASCDGPQPWEDLHDFGVLRPGRTRTRTYDVTCTVNDVGAWVEVTAELYSDARDPRSGNNKDTSRTDLAQ